MSKQQTALDFFISELESKGNSFENGMIGRVQISINVQDYQKLKDQAKQMGKEQIERAYVRGDVDSFGGIHHSEYYGNKSAEQYYNETYVGQEE
jgi:hypothetical protein